MLPCNLIHFPRSIQWCMRFSGAGSFLALKRRRFPFEKMFAYLFLSQVEFHMLVIGLLLWVGGVSLALLSRRGKGRDIVCRRQKGSVRSDHGTEGGPAPAPARKLLARKGGEGCCEPRWRGDQVVVGTIRDLRSWSVSMCLLLLRRRRKSVHHHARGDTQGEDITPYLKQEATVWCGGLR